MQIRLATDQDSLKWNEFCSRHSQVSPYHHYGWKLSIEKAYGHQCFYLLAENSAHDIIGVLPSVAIKPPLITGKLSALPFCDYGASLALDDSIESALIDKAGEIATQQGLKSLEYRASQIDFVPEDKISAELAHRKVRMLLSLPDTSEQLLASFKSKLRSQVKKAGKNGLTIELGRSDQLVDEFYEVFSCNMKDLGSPTHSKKWFTQIKNNYNNEMIISVIKLEDEPVGAGIVLFNGSSAAIPWASTKRKYNKLSPNMMLYWSLLQYTTDQGYKTFDFGRSTYGEGTYKFKQQWGAKPVLLNWKTLLQSKTTVPEDIDNTQNRTREIVESIWQKLPLELTTYLGPKVRKYISL